MYESFFQLHRRPFCSTPQAEFYFPAASIENALQTLVRLVERAEGPGLLIGGPGTGKTLVCQMLKRRFCETFHVVLLNSAQLTTHRALLQHILFALELPYRGLDEGELLLAFMEFLQSQETSKTGLLLLVDEAHTLPTAVLEGLRTITNVTQDDQPRVHIILAGGSGLEERFAHPELSCFNQRLAARCYLQSLNYEETCGYVHWRISKAGASPDHVFAHDAWQPVYHATDGIPRLINQVCDHALILACAAGQSHLDGHRIEEAWADLQQLPTPWQPARTEPAETAGVVEFGGLAPEEEDSRDASIDSAPLMELEDRTTDSESLVAPNESEDMPDVPLSTEVADEQTMTGQVEQVAKHARPSNPFDEPYEHEQMVVDRFASLQSVGGGTSPTEMQQRQMAVAMQTIFQDPTQLVSPVAEAGPLEPAPAAPASPEPALTEPALTEPALTEPAERESALEDSALPEPIATETADESGMLLELADQHQEPSGTQVIRSLPADDNDMIVVVDDQHGETPLRSSGGIRHRLEYRQLFSRLRRR
ncbi:MAG: AAA family ATPase [Planctomycetaceae bacterium]|nr:MAG: AAA family ATPase [Planctomycetaceae bacterium]